MMNWKRPIANRRGAALVLALLVMLVLSGLALVAMNSVASSNTMSGMHRLSTQVMSMSEGLAELGVVRSGRQANAYNQQLHNTTCGEGGNSRLDRMRQGGCVKFGDGTDAHPLQAGPTGGNGGYGGIFDGGEFEAVESELEPQLNYIVRDPVAGPRTEGFGDEFCFVQVTVGSRARIDRQGGDGIQQGRALGRNAAQAMIGPVECN